MPFQHVTKGNNTDGYFQPSFFGKECDYLLACQSQIPFKLKALTQTS